MLKKLKQLLIYYLFSFKRNKIRNIKFNFIFILFLFLFILNLNIITKKIQIKVCLCTVGKLENKYILEFIEHYKKYNVDKIFIYDNNDINGENFKDILLYYLKINFIEIIDHRGEKRIQIKLFQDCYKKNYKIYNWLLFYDIDEYIHLKNYHNIKHYLIQNKFNQCQSIYLNWIIHTDNNLKYYDNRPLRKRFTQTLKVPKLCLGKTIIRGNIENLTFMSTHILDINIGRCDGFGNIIKIKKYKRSCNVPDYRYFYIDHYYSKSTEEFIEKINKGDAIFNQNIKIKYSRIFLYFKFNQITKEKINLFVEKAHINFSLLMNNLIKMNNYTFNYL